MRRKGVNLGIASAIFALMTGTVIAGLLPLIMPLGWAAGGVLDTGQTAPERWWLAGGAAVVLFAPLCWRMQAWERLWWLAVLMPGLAGAVMLFGWRASRDQPHPRLVEGTAAAMDAGVGLVTALPLFWAEGALPGLTGARGQVRSPLIDHLGARPLDRFDITSLRGISALVIAQPRLLQPAELVALDDWLRRGGRAVIFADPLLLWPSALPLGDPRRPPLTSLLDPLMAHWGLRLEPVLPGADGVDRRMLGAGHMLMLAGASRFTRMAQKEASTRCVMTEQGLMALCRVGQGRVRLVADADLLDDRLWLADRRWAARKEAHAADILPLLDGWVADPLSAPIQPAPRRVTNDAALIAALRLVLLAALGWAGLGWFGHRLLRAHKEM